MDGAPWDSSLISGKPSIVRWKRDNTHCRFFYPFKMKRNQRPNSHIDVSFTRDAGCFSAASKLLEVHNQRIHEECLKSAPPILFEIDHPTSLKPNKSQSSFQARGPNSLKKRKKIKSTSIMLISPENSRSSITLRRKNKLKKKFSFECELLNMENLSSKVTQFISLRTTESRATMCLILNRM